MNEGRLSFKMDYDQFIEILDQNNWTKLQDEFKLNNAVLSQTFLIWGSNSDNTWLLADFETKKNYDIEGNRLIEKPDTVVISESPTEKEQLMEPKDPHLIFSQVLDQNPIGTDKGYVYFLSQLNVNLGELNLEQLKRPDLSGAGFSFESIHSRMLIVHKMFYDILTSTNDLLIDISRKELQQIVTNLKKFYDYLEQIKKFEVKGENPSDNYKKILTNVAQFCENMKVSLRNHIAYLNSNKVVQLEKHIDTTLAVTEERINKVINDEATKLQQTTEVLQKSEEKLEEIEQTHLKYQNQLTEKPISQYKAIFDAQAKKHGRNAWIWLGVTGLLVIAFGGIFLWLLVELEKAVSSANQLTTIVSSLFTKGFYLSLIFLILNRFIKNYAAEKHLEVINIHRQNALETFDAFVDAAEGNRETRDAVLLAATKAIFDANQSGYLSTKSSSSDTASPVQQIFKEVVPSKSSSDSN